MARQILGRHMLPLSPQSFQRRAIKYLDLRVHQRVTRETIAKDISHVRWLHRATLDEPMSARLSLTLQLLQRGCKSLHAVTHRTKKALPMTRSIMEKLTRDNSPTSLVIRLAFETASRLDDIFRLTHRSFLPYRHEGMLILWDSTKANITAEKRADHQQIIHNASSLRCFLRDPTILSRTSLQRCLTKLRSVKPSQHYIASWQRLHTTAKLRDHFTLHSLKRGRAAELWQQAAHGSITLELLLHRLKHKSIEAALAYAPCPALAARAIERSKMSSTRKSVRRSRQRTEL